MKIKDEWVLPGKIVVAVTWLLSLACVLAPSAFPSALATLGKVIFWLMLVAHVVELFAMWLPVARRAPGSFLGNVVSVLVFGVLHGQAMRSAIERSSAAGAGSAPLQ